MSAISLSWQPPPLFLAGPGLSLKRHLLKGFGEYAFDSDQYLNGEQTALQLQLPGSAVRETLHSH